MKTEILLVATDHMTGLLGLCFESLVINEDLYMVSPDPIQIAHDYCEHVNGIDQIGSIHDELEALGGIMFVRGYNEILRRDNVGIFYNFDQNIAADIVRMYGEREITDFTPCDKSDWAKADGIIYEARKGIIEEYWSSGIDYREYRAYIDSCAAYMEQGYNKAEQRYPSRMVANDLFWAMFEAVETIECDYEGQRFELSIDEAKARVYLEQLE